MCYIKISITSESSIELTFVQQCKSSGTRIYGYHGYHMMEYGRFDGIYGRSFTPEILYHNVFPFVHVHAVSSQRNISPSGADSVSDSSSVNSAHE